MKARRVAGRICCHTTFINYYSQIRLPNLERIADGEVQGMGVLEAVDVEVARTAGVVGHVQGYAPVDAYNQESEVIAQAEARPQCQLVEEPRGVEFGCVHNLVHVIHLVSHLLGGV